MFHDFPHSEAVNRPIFNDEGWTPADRHKRCYWEFERPRVRPPGNLLSKYYHKYRAIEGGRSLGDREGDSSRGERDLKLALGSPADVRLGFCVTSNAGPNGGCVTVREMKEGPSGSAIMSLIPSHCKLLSSKAMVVNVAEKSGR